MPVEFHQELIVNGYSVATQTLEADGTMREISFSVAIERSSWVALRILATSHINPIFVLVDDKPIRASKRSAQWCIDAVDKCWTMKRDAIREEERDDAKAAYDLARKAYEKILSESEID